MTRIPTGAIPIPPTGGPSWSLSNPQWLPWPADAQPRIRLIIDNDFAGDPDDLFQLVHHLLSPSVEIAAIICSHLRPQDEPVGASAAGAVKVARDVLRRMGLNDTHLLQRDSEEALSDASTPRPSVAAQAILDEAHRDDPRPLFYAAGAGLTELASAYLMDPAIAERLTLVWIGGLQHDDIVGHVGRFQAEYNRDIDLVAAQVVFSSGIEIWQVPRNLYRYCILSEAEMRERVARDGGSLGQYMYKENHHVLAELTPHIGRAEIYPMGDQPLVLLTVLEDGRTRDDDFSPNQWIAKPTPSITDAGTYMASPAARPMRVYTYLDQRLMFEDLFVKLREFARWQQGIAAQRADT
jgi:purine nucleosidase